MEHYDFKNGVYWKTTHKWVLVNLIDKVFCLTNKKYEVWTLSIPTIDWCFDIIINNKHHEIEAISLK